MPAPQIILDLIQRSSDSRDQCRFGYHSEVQLHREFFNLLCVVLSWGLTKQQGYDHQYREIIQEAFLSIEGQAIAPNYEFTIGK